MPRRNVCVIHVWDWTVHVLGMPPLAGPAKTFGSVDEPGCPGVLSSARGGGGGAELAEDKDVVVNAGVSAGDDDPGVSGAVTDRLDAESAFKIAAIRPPIVVNSAIASLIPLSSP